MEQNELPIGFGMALAQHPNAMRRFINMPESQRAMILQQAHAVSSKDEMQSIVDSLNANP